MTDKMLNSHLGVGQRSLKSCTWLSSISIFLSTLYTFGISIAGRILRVYIAIDFPQKRFNALYAWMARFIRLVLSLSLSLSLSFSLSAKLSNWKAWF